MKSQKIVLNLGVVCILFGLLALTTSASATLISSLGDPYDYSALIGGTVVTFEPAQVAAGQYDTLTLGDLTITAPGGNFVIGSAMSGLYNVEGFGSLYNYNSTYTTSSFRFDFGVPVNAFAFNFGGSDFAWQLSAYTSGDALLETVELPVLNNNNNGEYYGIAASGIISYATLVVSSNDWVLIDNFTYVDPPGELENNGAPVPEPTTMLLLGSGLLGLAGYGRKKFFKK